MLYPLSYEGAPLYSTGFACDAGVMTVWIDQPLWPAHGTMFAHMVSDFRLDELHDVARRTGLSPRAFDQDHYDVPAHLIEVAVAHGARQVSANELVRRLIASPLRIPAKERPAKIRARLLRDWEALAPGHPELGRVLLGRWEAPNRGYHSSVHLGEVLEHLAVLTQDGPSEASSSRILRAAAWYHDAIYDGVPGQDETRSAQLCGRELEGIMVPDELSRAVGLIEATADHTQECRDPLWPLFHDADLGILAAPGARYDRYAADVRAEYAHVPDREFCAARATILEGFLAQDRMFLTRGARDRWEARARANVAAEVRRLREF